METKIRDRKTPHAIACNLYGGKSTDMVWAWCFKDGNPEEKLIKKYIPISNVYVNENTQHIPDDKFRKADLRKFHVDVWNQKAKNFDKHNKFMTNYELSDYFSRASLTDFLE